MSDLEARVARLEAESEVRRLLHRYVHGVDNASWDQLARCFDVNAHVKVVNYPPGSGRSDEFRGHERISLLYAPLRAGSYRHHSANASITVAADATAAEVSSYFLTASDLALGGGLYEGTAHLTPDGWRLTTWQVTSSWGWKVGAERPYLAELLATGTLRGGLPA
jgi:SnoaL-like domain